MFGVDCSSHCSFCWVLHVHSGCVIPSIAPIITVLALPPRYIALSCYYVSTSATLLGVMIIQHIKSENLILKKEGVKAENGVRHLKPLPP